MSRVLSAAWRFCAGIVAVVSLHSLSLPIACAQQAAAEQLPPVEVTMPDDQNRTRARATGDGDTARRRAWPSGAPTGTGSSGSGGEAVASNGGIVGAATSVITAADIAHSPAQPNTRILAHTHPRLDEGPRAIRRSASSR